MSKYIEEVKLDFQANYLDGDDIQGGQMLSSEACFEAIKDALQKQIEMIEGEVLKHKCKVFPRSEDIEVLSISDIRSILNQYK